MRRHGNKRPRPARLAALGLVVAGLVACGGGEATPSDGGPPDVEPPSDAPDAGSTYPACAEFVTPTVTATALPLAYEGNLAGAGADIAAPRACDEIDAPFGLASDGADEVVRVDGLSPGSGYVVRVAGTSDLGFYVATGCDSESGPSAQECLLFVDATTDGPEIGRFTAPDSGTVYVVVDYWSAGYPDSTDFRLEVYPSECDASDQCGGMTPVCQDYRCVGCSSDFDCTDPAAPLCDEPSYTCVPGYGNCTGDDATEDGDDGPAGARDLFPGQINQAAICDSPSSEKDFFRFHVDQNGESWTITLAWTASVDLDLTVYDAAGQRVGMSFYEKPERIALTYLPAGDYYAAVDYFSSTGTSSATPYAISATRTTGGSCTSAADCAAEYRNQVFRGECVAGACQRIDGQGLREAGERCDSRSDCTLDTNCASFFFVADADERMVCGSYCSSDADCAGMGPDYVCTTYLTENFCVARCTTDDQCPTVINSSPFTPPWLRFACEPFSGRCLPP